MANNTEPLPRERPRQVFAVMYFAAIAIASLLGFVLSGSALATRLLVAAAAGLGGAAVLTGVLWAVYTWLKARCARMDDAAQPIIDQLDAMSDDELRESALAAIRDTGYFQTLPASSPVDPLWPRDVREVFNAFDRVEFRFTGEQAAYFTLDRNEVDPVAHAPDALRVGRMSLPGWFVAVHVPTGRSLTCYRAISADALAQAATHPPSSHRSLWHLIAVNAARHRIALLAKNPTRDRSPSAK